MSIFSQLNYFNEIIRPKFIIHNFNIFYDLLIIMRWWSSHTSVGLDVNF